MSQLISVEHVKEAIRNSWYCESKLSDGLDNPMNLSGMSSARVRHLFNNLCNFDFCNYFEIGSFLGSTFCSAIYKNKCNAISCDNFSEFNANKINKALLMKNVNKFKGNNNIKLIDKSFYDLDKKDIGKFNVFFYDGEHNYKSQYDGLMLFKDCFEDRVIVLVDDFRQPMQEDLFSVPFYPVRDATFKAIYDIGWKILYRAELPPFKLESYSNDVDDRVHSEGYWNGMYVVLLENPNLI